MMLLAVSGLAFVLPAHRCGVFTATLFSTVVLLFMVIPLVPWGLREALRAVRTLYLIFTGSPVAETTSNSRGSGSGWISLARVTSLLVSPLIAETTTTS